MWSGDVVLLVPSVGGERGEVGGEGGREEGEGLCYSVRPEQLPRGSSCEPIMSAHSLDHPQPL